MSERALDLSVVRDLRLAVDRAGCTLDDAVHEAIRGVYQTAGAGLDTDAWLALAPEYGRAECLANLDPGGDVVLPSPAALRAYRDLAGRVPAFRGWFQEVEIAGRGAALLPARWLCHLAGLRHPTVQAIIDDESEGGRLLVQVRGLARPEAPGCFDMPVAGHVAGMTGPEAALAGELSEELGLTLDEVTPPELLGAYEHVEGLDGIFRNNERRMVFRCRLKPGALARVRFLDGEVAAICLFEIAELAALIDRFPDRIASGLLETFPRYLGGRVATGMRGG